MASAALTKAAQENGKKGGRPKGFAAKSAEEARAYIVKRVNEELEPIISKQLEQALAGDKDARRDLMDRAYGKPKETVELLGVKKILVDF